MGSSGNAEYMGESAPIYYLDKSPCQDLLIVALASPSVLPSV